MHVQRPVRAGAQYFNYKRSFSVNMMGVVDAHYKFLYVAVGAQGSANDSAVFNASNFAKAVADPSNPLNIPHARVITNTNIETPMMFVADDAYPLRPNIMKPFSSRGLSPSERIFNYRLSRARRVVENAFGILVARFRILRGNMQLQPPQVCEVVMACCVLHNFLRQRAQDELPDNLEAHNGADMQPLLNVTHEPRVSGAHYNANSKRIRDKLASYFVGEGQVSWQWKHGNVVPPDDDNCD